MLPALAKACWQEQATPGVYVEALPIARSLLGAAVRSRVILRGEAEVGGCWVALLSTPPPPSWDAGIMSWTQSSAPMVRPPPPRPLGRGLRV